MGKKHIELSDTTGKRNGIENHQPFLMACFTKLVMEGPEKAKPVLELGAGHYSTPLLHYACKAAGITLVTLDSDKAWVAQFDDLRSPQHHIFHVPNWDACDVLDREWSIVLVDHAPGNRRGAELLRVKGKARWYVVHDSQMTATGYPEVRPQFLYLRHYNRDCPEIRTMTDVLSDTDDLTWLD